MTNCVILVQCFILIMYLLYILYTYMIKHITTIQNLCWFYLPSVCRQQIKINEMPSVDDITVTHGNNMPYFTIIDKLWGVLRTIWRRLTVV